ncbi:hypothetical protein ACHWQZ_G011750 [Mnemiopsis leidyi]
MAPTASETPLAESNPGAEYSDMNFDCMFKILLIGNSGVGKTSFLLQYCEGKFNPAFVSTVGIDFKVKTVTVKDKRIKLQVWDTAGQERYKIITTQYYRHAMGFLVMYDITNETSFLDIRNWLSQVQQHSFGNAQIIIVANKSDLEDQRAVPTQRGKDLASELGYDFFEASAKTSDSVQSTFHALVSSICVQMADSVNDLEDKADTVPLNKSQASDSSCLC